MEVKKVKLFYPNLDGLRFISFMLVFIHHSFITDYSNILSNQTYQFIKQKICSQGTLGVNFFFVLSGFLITMLLLKEKELSGKINIKNFYIRRSLRIWPLFYFCVLFGFFLFPILKNAFGKVSTFETSEIFYYFSFLNNFHVIKNAPTLGILWSIAVEEQFYFLWPILLTIVPLKHYEKMFFIIIAISLIFRAIYYNNIAVRETHTLACISDMTIGGLMAFYTFKESKIFFQIKNMRPALIAMIYLLILAFCLFRRSIFSTPVLIPFERLMIGIGFSFIVLEQNFAQNSLFKIGNNKLISKLGKYTYGLYCLHMIGILIAQTLLKTVHYNNQLWQVIIIEGFLSLIITIVLALISYHFFESKFLKLKDKFSIFTSSN